MASKVTFTLDDETVLSIRRLAERARKPQSLIVREAVACYAGREDLLSEDERQQTLAVLRDLGEKLPTRPREDRKSTRLNSSHSQISYAVFCLKKKNKKQIR